MSAPSDKQQSGKSGRGSGKRAERMLRVLPGLTLILLETWSAKQEVRGDNLRFQS